MALCRQYSSNMSSEGAVCLLAFIILCDLGDTRSCCVVHVIDYCPGVSIRDG